MKLKVKEEKALGFLIGLAMFIGGLAWLISNIYVTTPFHTGEISVGGVYLRSGIFVLPLVAGLVFWFLKPSRKWPKLLCAASVLLIAAVIVLSVTIRLKPVSLIKWVLILFLIAGGVAEMALSVYWKKKK